MQRWQPKTRDGFANWSPKDVAAGGTAPAVTTASLPDGDVDLSYSAQLAASGSTPITWSFVSGAPPWASVSSGGLITGTPTPGVWPSVIVRATNGAGTHDRTLSITVPNESGGGSVQIPLGPATVEASRTVDVVTVITMTAVGRLTGITPVDMPLYTVAITDQNTINMQMGAIPDALPKGPIRPIAVALLSNTVEPMQAQAALQAAASLSLVRAVDGALYTIQFGNGGSAGWPGNSAIVFEVPRRVADSLANGAGIVFVAGSAE